MIDINADMIAFQVTRRCNQSCNHCCKGKMQNIDMTKDIIDNFFNNDEYKIVRISNLSITGGEPTLVPDVIEYLINKIIENNIYITNNIIMFTNGLVYSEKYINSIYKLINYLKTNKECENTKISFEISNDQFHKNIPESILKKYRKIDFIPNKKLRPYILTKSQIQNTGNAKDNNLGGRDTNSVPENNYIIKKDNIIEIKNAIIISANGNICSEKYGCSTFDEEDQFTYGNLLSQSFLNIINKFPEFEKEEKKLK